MVPTCEFHLKFVMILLNTSIQEHFKEHIPGNLHPDDFAHLEFRLIACRGKWPALLGSSYTCPNMVVLSFQ